MPVTPFLFAKIMAKKVNYIHATRNGIERKFYPQTWNTMDDGEGGKYGWVEVSKHQNEVPKAVKENIVKSKPVKEGKAPVNQTPAIPDIIGDVNE